MNLSEAARFQGFDPRTIRWPSEADGFRLLGNTMSVCVAQRVVQRMLQALDRRPPSCKGPWETGSAQAKLREAAGSAPGGPSAAQTDRPR